MPSLAAPALPLGDLAKLASSYPHVRAFRAVARTLDLQDMWRALLTARAQAQRPKVRHVPASIPPSSRPPCSLLSCSICQFLAALWPWPATLASAVYDPQLTLLHCLPPCNVRRWALLHRNGPPVDAPRTRFSQLHPSRSEPNRHVLHNTCAPCSPQNAPPVQLSARTFQAGLSTLAQELLGKPLDKTMQVIHACLGRNSFKSRSNLSGFRCTSKTSVTLNATSYG